MAAAPLSKFKYFSDWLALELLIRPPELALIGAEPWRSPIAFTDRYTAPALTSSYSLLTAQVQLQPTDNPVFSHILLQSVTHSYAYYPPLQYSKMD